jgi:transposase
MNWLPQGHLAYFIIDVVKQLDLSGIYSVYEKDRDEQPPYDPAMMTALLLYAYCVGVPSSRKIEKKTYEDVAFRVVAANRHPGHDSICAFRKRHLSALAALFVRILRLCQEPGLVRLGHVALDGTAVRGRPPQDMTANERMQRKLRTKRGKALYAKRKAVVEPVFGQIKQTKGLRQFLLRGLENVAAEWPLWCLTHNLLKLHRHSAALQ